MPPGAPRPPAAGDAGAETLTSPAQWHVAEVEVTWRERVDQLYTLPAARMAYGALILLTAFLLVWTLWTHDVHSMGIHACEGVLTAAFCAEVSVRVWVSWPALLRSCILQCEVILSAACVIVFVVAVALPTRDSEEVDATEEAVLFVRYTAQALRIIVLWHEQRSSRGRRGVELCFRDPSSPLRQSRETTVHLGDVHEWARSHSTPLSAHDIPSPPRDRGHVPPAPAASDGRVPAHLLDAPIDHDDDHSPHRGAGVSGGGQGSATDGFPDPRRDRVTL